ncbi:MAG: hypothetical protein H6Q72_376 [Firmicutes bacterium]|nr:hypothetical protein [Bacillota bacterium]
MSAKHKKMKAVVKRAAICLVIRQIAAYYFALLKNSYKNCIGMQFSYEFFIIICGRVDNSGSGVCLAYGILNARQTS